MKLIGIEFAGSYMNYVVLEMNDNNEVHIIQSNRLVLDDSRSRGSLVSFQNAVSTLFNTAIPDVIAIKSKPESGAMKAGAASLKMEGIVVANSPCEVDFVSGSRVNKCNVEDPSLYAYLQPALKTAHAALAKCLA